MTGALGAEALTEAIAAVDGVRGLFPEQVLRAVLAAPAGGTRALVELDQDAAGAVVRARLALDKDAPTVETLHRVCDAVRAALGDERVRMEIEVAYLD